MNKKEAIEKALNSKWKLHTCDVGDTCWCRGVTSEDPIIFNDGEVLGIIPTDSVLTEIAEHIVFQHNVALEFIEKLEKMEKHFKNIENEREE